VGVGGGQAVGEGVGGGVGVGRRAILVFSGVWKGKRGVFSFFYFFLEGGSVAGQVFCVGVCEIGGLPDWRGVWRWRCETGVPCVACLLWIWL
jgi:hypothetical protein